MMLLWLVCMRRHTAFFLVAGKELTNHHRLVGNYGVGGRHMGRA
jgi:hypothetical protein